VAYFLAFLAVPDLSTQVRYAGVLLETFGFILVAVGIRDTRKLFNRPSLTKNFVDWCHYVANAFARQEHPAASSATARFELRTPSVSFTASVKPATLEERVDLLDEKVTSLQQQTDELMRQLSRDSSKLEDDIKKEREARTSAIAAEAHRVEQLAVGGLKYEIVGLIWVVFGSLGSNAPDEIVRIISHFR